MNIVHIVCEFSPFEDLWPRAHTVSQPMTHNAEDVEMAIISLTYIVSLSVLAAIAYDDLCHEKTFKA